MDLNFYQKIGYFLLIALFFISIIYIFLFNKTLDKRYKLKNVMKSCGINTYNDDINNYYNNKEDDILEGFNNVKELEQTKIEYIINNKLKSLETEFGDKKGLENTKSLLTNTKKICDMECMKCMINMIDSSKGSTNMDVEKLINDEKNENCVKCKKYTELSQRIQNMIDSISFD